jgi:ABC-type branched-subunit amino acid transport system substrate-binding protein
MSGRKKLITSALTRRRVAAGGTAALVLSPFIIRPGVAQRATVNIGVIQPLSGANAQFGVNCRNGIELVADEINAAGGIKALGGAKISLVVSDATSNPTIAPAVARRLIAENDLTAVIGAFASSLTLAISEVTARADIPFVDYARLPRAPFIDDPHLSLAPSPRRDTYGSMASAANGNPLPAQVAGFFDRSDYTSPGRRPRSIHGNVTSQIEQGSHHDRNH